MTLPTVTPNYKLKKPLFDISPWHDDVNGNFDLIDALLYSVGVVENIVGHWKYNQQYQPNDRTVDPDTGQIWRNTVQHSSPNTGSFAEYRTAFPNHWVLTSPGTVFRGPWTPNTKYAPNDIVYDGADGLVALSKHDHTSGIISLRMDAANWTWIIDLKSVITATSQNAAITADNVVVSNQLLTEVVGYAQAAYFARVGAEEARDVFPVGGTIGQVLMKRSNTIYDMEWYDLLGGGDMISGMYDPDGKHLDVYNRQNHYGTIPLSDVTGGEVLAPPGLVAPFAMVNAPAGWLKCDGALLNTVTYAALFAAIGYVFGGSGGNFRLPDLRGEFIRGFDDGRGIDAGRVFGSAQAHAYASHTHTATATSAGGHTHTPTMGTYSHSHSGTTASAGNHYHQMGERSQIYAYKHSLNNVVMGSFYDGDGTLNHGRRWYYTDDAGAHTHTFSTSADTHSHTLSLATAGDHTHTVTVAAIGGSETRPRNVALLYCIKY